MNTQNIRRLKKAVNWCFACSHLNYFDGLKIQNIYPHTFKERRKSQKKRKKEYTFITKDTNHFFPCCGKFYKFFVIVDLTESLRVYI